MLNSRFLFQLTVAVLLSFSAAATLCAAVKTEASVTETLQANGSTEYTVDNFPNNPINISILLSTTTGTSPSTTNANWFAVTVDAASWVQSMGEPEPILNSTLPTWQQYTGLTYTQAFPGNPAKLNGYFLDYTFNSGADTLSNPGEPVIPGASLGGFFFEGSPASTFLLVGPTDGTTTFAPGDPTVVMSFTGASNDVPEPAGMALGGLALRRRRRDA